MDKAVVIGAEYALGYQSGAPSWSDLRQANFKLVGTIAYGGWDPNWEWKKAQQWVQAAHAAGFRVFINVLADSGDQLLSMTQQSAMIGADIVALDEPISLFPSSVTQAQLQAIIGAGRAINSNLQYYINEWSRDYIRKAYQWTTEYPYVRIAEDNYDDKTTIDFNIQLGAQYGKAPLVWLIFTLGSQDFDCYRNLDQWMTYLHQSNIDTLFWLVDHSGNWKTQWQKVVSYTP
jgi:hypothetical protein